MFFSVTFANIDIHSMPNKTPTLATFGTCFKLILVWLEKVHPAGFTPRVISPPKLIIIWLEVEPVNFAFIFVLQLFDFLLDSCLTLVFIDLLK